MKKPVKSFYMLLLILVSLWLQFVSAQLIPCKAAQHLADSECVCTVYPRSITLQASLISLQDYCKCPKWVNNRRKWHHSIKKKHWFSVCSEIREAGVFPTQPNKDNSYVRKIHDFPTLVSLQETLSKKSPIGATLSSPSKVCAPCRLSPWPWPGFESDPWTLAACRPPSLSQSLSSSYPIN